MRAFLLVLLIVTAAHAEPALTIYNQNFAVVRNATLCRSTSKARLSDVRFADATGVDGPGGSRVQA